MDQTGADRRAPFARRRGVLADPCAEYVGCQSCVADPGCGYIGGRDVCVAGGWLTPCDNYTREDAWSYYHRHCLVGTRVEFVLLPAALALTVLVLAIVAIWRSWWAQLDASAAYEAEDARRQDVFPPEEHMPLLIDNDPGSRGLAPHSPYGANGSFRATPVVPRAPLGPRWGGPATPASPSSEHRLTSQDASDSAGAGADAHLRCD
ncbi:hypothetical protein H4R21_004452 [Coemansia helicoidea]|uniref:Uncharacterized protein n=1 Tax=Coemansia helicoidea TaxID=1286919 RepID=A0ACC1KX54_9FUNG|nr:hypothetical protein H4R21_004452 [Coemansia helicoidea]